MKSVLTLASLIITTISASAQVDWKTVESNGIKFDYKINGANLQGKVSCATNGWVAVGFDPDVKMMGADIIIGYVDANGAHVRDDFGNKEKFHVSDVSLGGIDNLTEIGGSEVNGVTEISFTTPLNSGDPFDKVLDPAQPHIIMMACGKAGTDNFTGLHSKVAVVNVTGL